MNGQPHLSIGLPVFNGERFLAQALDSLLAQNCDFELIMSDNASTDSTPEICLEFAAKDRRVRYLRYQENRGAAWNFNRVFELSSGTYFKWAAHDDLCGPGYLERCVEVLDQDSSVVLCHSKTREIDEQGTVVRDLALKPRLGSALAHERFHECVCVPHPQVLVFGVMRAGVLRKTRLIGSYSSSDRVLLGELALWGRFHEVPELLFYHRNHPQQSFKVFRGRHVYQAWFDPKRAGKITFPHWRLLREHFVSIGRVPISGQERMRCYLCLARWARRNWQNLAYNLIQREVKKPAPAPVRAPSGQPG